MAEEYYKKIRLARACVEKPAAEHVSMNVATKQAKVERDTLPARIFKVEIAAARHKG